jgi:hypothetical protein
MRFLLRIIFSLPITETRRRYHNYQNQITRTGIQLLTIILFICSRPGFPMIQCYLYVQGCPCHTYEYGCCPDGESIARGPAQEGCTCKDREFGCCPDRRTPAQVLGLRALSTVQLSFESMHARYRAPVYPTLLTWDLIWTASILWILYL